MSQQFGWIIEAGWTVPPDLKYWVGCNTTGGGGVQHEWSKDDGKAIRFAREKDAKKIANALIDSEAHRVVEHAWS